MLHPMLPWRWDHQRMSHRLRAVRWPEGTVAFALKADSKAERTLRTRVLYTTSTAGVCLARVSVGDNTQGLHIRVSIHPRAKSSADCLGLTIHCGSDKLLVSKAFKVTAKRQSRRHLVGGGGGTRWEEFLTILEVNDEIRSEEINVWRENRDHRLNILVVIDNYNILPTLTHRNRTFTN